MLEEDKDQSKIKRREAKRIVAIARKQGTQKLYDELATKEGENESTRLQRQGRESGKRLGTLIS